MRIKTVRIENFKRFRNLEVELGRLDCHVGPNNSGKTTLLQALALFDFCVHHCIEKKNGSDYSLRGKRTISPEEFYVLPVANPMDIWHDRRTMESGKQRRIKIAVSFDNGDEATTTLKLDFNRFGVSVELADKSQKAIQRLVDLRLAYLPVFSMFLPLEERRLSAAIQDELTRGRVHGVIRNLILDLKSDGRHEELIAVMRRSFPGLRNLSVEFDEVTDRYIKITYGEEGHAKEFDIYSAGSGFQQFLYLFGFILLRRPTTIMLDEPDKHLHGSLQAVLLNELQRLVDDGKQVLFATHSRDLIARVGPENILSLDHEGARRLHVAFDVYDTLDRLGSIDPSQLAVVQAFRRVAVVEDRTDHELLSILCATSLGAEIWQQVERRVAFCYAKGNPWKQDINRLRDVLNQLIASTGAALEMFVIADRDYYPDLLELRSSLPQAHMSWHIWERTEIENYLLHTPAIVRIVQERKDVKSLADTFVESEFDRLVESSRNRANDRLVQAFDEIRKRKKVGWDAATMARMAREFLDENWVGQRIALADAKDIVLPGIKRWLQKQGIGQFTDHKLASMLKHDELPAEVHDLAKSLADFAKVKIKS